jgi:hypothetical protein
MITVLRQYMEDCKDDELYIIATNVLGEQIKGLKIQIGIQVSQARLRLNMDNLKGSNEALGEARKLKAQYKYLRQQYELVAPSDAEDPDKESPADGEDGPAQPMTASQLEDLLEPERQLVP